MFYIQIPNVKSIDTSASLLHPKNVYYILIFQINNSVQDVVHNLSLRTIFIDTVLTLLFIRVHAHYMTTTRGYIDQIFTISNPHVARRI